MPNRLTALALSLCLLVPIAARAQRVAFTSENEYPVGLAPRAVAVGDVDGDELDDIAVANSDDDTVSVLVGTGSGEFIDTGATYEVGLYPFAIVIVDVNGDGNGDIVTSDENEDTVSVLVNDGFGSFSARAAFDTGSSPQGLVVRDFDGDGKRDLATANYVDETVTILKGSGTGNFTREQDDIPVGEGPVGLNSGDLDGDGKLDLVVTNTVGGLDSNGSLSLLKGNGNGTFVVQPEFVLPEICGAIGCLPWAVEIEDFDGDSKADLVTTNQDGDSVAIFRGNGDFSFQAPTVIEVSTTPAASALADFDGDGKVDIVTIGSDDDLVTVLLGGGDGTFAEGIDFDTGLTPMGIAVGHFNADSKPDMVIATQDDDAITVFLNVATAAPCGGDCDGDQAVEMSELVNMIDLALERSGAASCANGDTDSMGGITVEEIVGAVKNAAAGGCAQ